jgi:hypothetical protein
LFGDGSISRRDALSRSRINAFRSLSLLFVVAGFAPDRFHTTLFWRIPTMSYSRSDFADDVINCLIDVGALDAASIPENDPRAEASLALAAITALQRGSLAARFANEVLNAVESLSAVAEQRGVHSLADLFYLQTAILEGTYVQLDALSTPIFELVRTLPSVSEWRRHIQFETHGCLSYLVGPEKFSLRISATSCGQ